MLAAGSEAPELLVAAGPMGAERGGAAGLAHEVVGAAAAESTADDTRAAAAAMAARGVELLLFAGGDGTAVDVLAAVGDRVPVLGIPAGVKMHSAVFALTPRRAGELARALVEGRPAPVADAEVADIDEDALREGSIAPRLHGFLRVPVAPRARAGGEGALAAPARRRRRRPSRRYVVEQLLRPGRLCWWGPGRRPAPCSRRWGCAKVPLGVDVLRGGRAGGGRRRRGGAAAAGRRRAGARCCVTPVGGQGFVLGRGNQQLSAAVLRAAGPANLTVAGDRRQARRAAAARPLRVDTGDRGARRGARRLRARRHRLRSHQRLPGRALTVEQAKERRMPQARAHPYIPNSAPAVKQAMLQAVGAADVDELYAGDPGAPALPAAARPAAGAGVRGRPAPRARGPPGAQHEHPRGAQLPRRRLLAALRAGGRATRSSSRAEFLTAYCGETYTDHGKYQAFFEYASLIGELVGAGRGQRADVRLGDGGGERDLRWPAASRAARACSCRRRWAPSGSRVVRRRLRAAAAGRRRRRTTTGDRAARPRRARGGARATTSPRSTSRTRPTSACIERSAPEIAAARPRRGRARRRRRRPDLARRARAAAALRRRHRLRRAAAARRPHALRRRPGGLHRDAATRSAFVAEYPTFLIGLAPTREQGEYGFGWSPMERTSYVQRERREGLRRHDAVAVGDRRGGLPLAARAARAARARRGHPAARALRRRSGSARSRACARRARGAPLQGVRRRLRRHRQDRRRRSTRRCASAASSAATT